MWSYLDLNFDANSTCPLTIPIQYQLKMRWTTEAGRNFCLISTSYNKSQLDVIWADSSCVQLEPTIRQTGSSCPMLSPKPQRIQVSVLVHIGCDYLLELTRFLELP